MLLVEQGELGPFLEFLCRVPQQMPAWPNGAGEETVGGSSTRLRRKSGPKVLKPLPATLLGEEPALLGAWAVEQIGDVPVDSVVQVCGPMQRIPLATQDSKEIGEVLAVVLHLHTGVQSRAARVLYGNQGFGFLVSGRVGPLFQLNDQIGIVSAARIDPGEHRVDPPASQRQLVFDKHLYLTEAGVGEILGQHRQAIRP
ncbi:hypothetical protein [Micromonospora endophytica]|uniref:hypothetical protein n=1 Tax=Micromonospora endophytica TaxID=515350 RepID=UPI0015E8928C|nr:hypothetical protein [Micromonospora endophytica]